MERYEIQKLRDLPIEGVAQRLGLEVARHKALCPFHDDRHPSLSFSVRRNSYRCFVCGASGGTIDLVMVLNLLKPGDALYITEGSSDCWAMLSAGHKAIAIPSATLLTKRDVELLSMVNVQWSMEFHMYPDRDEPGERLFLQLQRVLPSLVHHQLPPGCKDFSDYYLSQTTRNPVGHDP